MGRDKTRRDYKGLAGMAPSLVPYRNSDSKSPLTPLHRELLQTIKDTNQSGKWLFPHQDGQQPRNADALCQATRRFCVKNHWKTFAPRDCRRTFKTLSGSIGIDLELRNRLQGHAMTDVGSVHYDRWSYLPQKREGMELWTKALENRLREIHTIGTKR